METFLCLCTGDLTDCLSEQFDKDLNWNDNHLNGLPLYAMMMALKPLITTNMGGAVYISNDHSIDKFELSREDKGCKHTYRIDIDDNDHCCYVVTKIR